MTAKKLTTPFMQDLLSEMADANLMPYRPGKADIWVEVLDDLDADAIEEAVLRIIRTHRSGGRMPTPGDVRALVEAGANK